MPIITIATTKGGAGKTTIARALLGHAAQRGYKTAAIDADINHSLAEWADTIAKYPITVRRELNETRIVPTVEELQEDHDFIVIDTPGAPSQTTVFAIGCADLVLVSCKLSSSDVAEAIKTMQLVQSAGKMLGHEIPARIALTSFKPRTNVAAHVESELASVNMPIMRARLDDLVAFTDMTYNGLVPRTGLAGSQIDALFDEAMALIEPPPVVTKKRAS